MAVAAILVQCRHDSLHDRKAYGRTPILAPRKPAPALSVPLLSGGTFTLAERKPRTFTVIVFYRGKHCPICSKYLGQVQEQLDRAHELAAEVVAISMDGEDRARASAADWGVDRLEVGHGLSEPAARDWGLYISAKREGSQEPDRFSEPGLFVIRADGTVFFAQTQSGPFTRPTMDQLLDGLQFVLDKNYPARGDLTRAA
jgi:peroxiredoxin